MSAKFMLYFIFECSLISRIERLTCPFLVLFDSGHRITETKLKMMKWSCFRVSGFTAGVKGMTLGMTLLTWHSYSSF